MQRGKRPCLWSLRSLRCIAAFRFKETLYILVINFPSCVLFFLKWVSIPVKQELEPIQKWALAVCRIHLLSLMNKYPSKNECLLGRVTHVFSLNADKHFPHIGVRFENLVSN